jgi:UDPglucose--hexose-1-phosphate uridylyltransferase
MRERRRDPLSGEWRTFSADRQDRTFLPPADRCPLCPTTDADRPTEVPWASFDVAVFENRFPALTLDPPAPTRGDKGPYAVEPATGATEVVVYSDDHDASLSTVGAERVRLLVDVWADRYTELGRRAEVAYVFVFENRGEAIGVTLHHPHGQLYAYPEVPPVPARELAEAARHLERRGTCVLCDVVAQERSEAARLVARNSAFLAFVPFAARFPYEVHVVAHRHAPSLLDLTDPERDALAEMLIEVQRRYDGLFGFPLPYVMAMHQAPTDDGEWQAVSHLHIEFTPVHRTADRLKYLAGSELGAGAFLNDVAPEAAAEALRGSVPGR